MSEDAWPDLPFAAWQETYATLHLWTQVVGKLRLAQCAPINHWWHVPLYVTSRGLTTSPIPYHERTFQVDFDFVAHQLRIVDSDGSERTIALEPRTVADFYREVMGALWSMGIEVHIWPVPSELPDPIPFQDDTLHSAYDQDYANRFWRILVQSDRIFTEFRGRFLGKVSPVHFFWGSFDLAVTRFSGRLAPPHPGGGLLPLEITREAYSHEVSSAGFWPGGAGVEAMYYSYAYPQPEGFAAARVEPAAAYFAQAMGEFLLPYEAVRTAADPDAVLLRFLQSTYEAAADLGNWDRAALERRP